jgi:uncharacterized membrane protein
MRGQVLAGATVGLLSLAAGDRLRARGYANYAQSFSGGGVMILYLAVFAAYAFYNLIEQFPALLLMTAVTVAAVLLAARSNALPIAIIGFVGGFLTPSLLSSGVDNQAALFTYIAVLDAGALALARLKRWRILNYIAFAATVLIVTGWHFEWYAPPKLWMTLFFLTLLFLLFAAFTCFREAATQELWTDSTLVIANAVFYFSLSYALLLDSEYASGAQSALAILLCAFYGLVFYTARARIAGGSLLASTLFGLARQLVKPHRHRRYRLRSRVLSEIRFR